VGNDQPDLLAYNKFLNGLIVQLENKLQEALKTNSRIGEELFAKNKELQHIFSINSKLVSATPTGDMYALVARIGRSLMDGDVCVLRLLDHETRALHIVANRYSKDNVLKDFPTIKLGDGISGKVAQEKRVISVYDVDKNGLVKHDALVRLIRKRGVRSILAVPIVFRGKTLGVISVYSRTPCHFSPDKVKVLSVFASHIALSLQEAAHYREIHMTYFNTMRTLVLALETRDPYTHGHTERVTKYALDVGYTLGLEPDEVDTLRYAAEMHDIGKVSIPDFVLLKPDKLTSVERSIIQLHPVKGAQILAPLEFMRTVTPIVRHHHERFDGKGYPDGLEGEQIPLLARILACADSFDAMTSERPYRGYKLTPEQALAEIKKHAGTQFDPEIARQFIKIAKAYRYR